MKKPLGSSREACSGSVPALPTKIFTDLVRVVFEATLTNKKSGIELPNFIGFKTIELPNFIGYFNHIVSDIFKRLKENP